MSTGRIRVLASRAKNLSIKASRVVARVCLAKLPEVAGASVAEHTALRDRGRFSSGSRIRASMSRFKPPAATADRLLKASGMNVVSSNGLVR